ncbi:MAG: ParB-like nuclease domain-containing protein [Paludibacteraceae bacterium]|nr:ParB-like nuclease domain-containing protein [Paludibacteraceae bacterium]MBQ6963512.1 ParB-like nuclease domain-containing protein [Paludibacteraceae bacterium]MBQ7662475.1 ParB-like nuclease domain-containing protein [Prevotella sp.]MBQ7748302.1 ParB-like nuclease domain-containing protein [Paludibacteraceae bacterium]
MTKQKQTYEVKNIKVSDIEVNKGQIYGLPKNPRFIRDERFNALKHSIEEAPEMLGLRELLVYPYEGKYIVIGGNMRLRACLDLGYAEVPCKVLPEETPVAKLREYVIKDNESFGQNDWDILANEWDSEELKDWGVEGVFMNEDTDIDNFFEDSDSDTKSNNAEKLTVMIPDNLVDKKPDFKAMIEQTLCDYEGIKVV